jgi:NAD(P)-dependent dehydrogenase (short-subunit alcohol dehydrogenase family)
MKRNALSMFFESRWGRALTAVAAALAGARLLARRPMRLAGAVAVITGGSRGLGLTLARELAGRGCGLVLFARSEAELEAAERELAPLTDVLGLPCDVTDRAAVDRALAEAASRMGRLDIVINNASIIQVGPLEALTDDDFRAAMEVNFWGTVNTTMAALPYLRGRRGARICNITSIGGKVSMPHLLPYGCAKFAAVGFSEGLRAELAKDGILVTTVVPGLMRTGSPENALFKGQREREYAWFSAGDATAISALSVERAARRIVRAIQRGETEVTLSWQAKVLRYAHALFPSLVVNVLGVMNRLLPRATGPDREAVRGRDLVNRSERIRRLIAEQARKTRQYVH